MGKGPDLFSSHDVKMGLLILRVLDLGVGGSLVLCFVSGVPPHSSFAMPSKCCGQPLMPVS